jgi:hypothetical protein
MKKFLIDLLLLLFCGALGAALLIEWFAGCGETYIDANGQRHAYECFFIKRSF